MSALGHKQTYALQQPMSALHPIGPGRAHELKHDGYRLQIRVRDDKSQSRNVLRMDERGPRQRERFN